MEENILDIITFDDDNHVKKVWLNGILINESNRIEDLICSCVKFCNNKCFDKFEISSIYLCDDFDEFDEDSDEIDNICYWFDTVKIMTNEQISCIKSRKWKNLLEII